MVFYCQDYLTPSMTFIYSQLKAIAKEKDLIVISSTKPHNLDLFPFQSIYYCPKNNFFNKVKHIFHQLFIQPPWDYICVPKLSRKQVKYFRKIFVDNKIKLVHAHFGPSALEIFPLLKELNIRLIVTFHGYDASKLLANQKYIKSLGLLFEYAKIITVSKYMFEKLRKYGLTEGNSSVIHCGIRVNEFKVNERKSPFEKYKNNERINLLQVSNFVEKKGHELTLRAFKKVLNQYENVNLILIGEGYLKPKMEMFAIKNNLREKVSFLGHIPFNEIPRVMHESDIFVHHSITTKEGDQEGIPTVIMEAMATGLPVVSTKHAGIPELIKHGDNGLLSNEGDYEGFANNILSLIKQPSNIHENGRKTIEGDFNFEKELKKQMDFYEQTLHGA